MGNLILALLILMFILCITPFLLWFRNNMAKIRETYDFKKKRQLILSWYWCYGLSIIILAIVLIIAFL